MPEAETRITRTFHLGDWVPLRDAVLQVISLVGGNRVLGLEMTNRSLRSGLLELALLAPDGSTLTRFSRTSVGPSTLRSSPQKVFAWSLTRPGNTWWDVPVSPS